MSINYFSNKEGKSSCQTVHSVLLRELFKPIIKIYEIIEANLPFSKRLIFRISRTIQIFCTKFINIINFLFYRLIWNWFWLFVILLWRMLFWRITAGLIAKKDSKLTRENILKLVRLALLATGCAALRCSRCRHSARRYSHHGTWSVKSIGSWCQS